MIKIRDLFKADSAKEAQEQIHRAQDALDKAAVMAKKCLGMPDFIEYRKDFERAEATMVDTIITYTKSFVESEHGDTTKYALNMVRLVTRIQDFRHLLRSVENDAKRPVKPGKDIDEVR